MHLLLGGGLDVSHVGFDHGKGISLDEAEQILGSLLVGGDLGGDVGEIVVEVPRRERAGRRMACKRSNCGRPGSITLKLLISTPSSARFVEKGGIEPGVLPPISAWWARLAVKNSSRPRCGSWTGVTTVTSGRWEPPRYGSLLIKTSPGRIVALSAKTCLTVSPIAPRWTGI